MYSKLRMKRLAACLGALALGVAIVPAISAGSSGGLTKGVAMFRAFTAWKRRILAVGLASAPRFLAVASAPAAQGREEKCGHTGGAVKRQRLHTNWRSS